jgi:hypothetical protein
MTDNKREQSEQEILKSMVETIGNYSIKIKKELNDNSEYPSFFDVFDTIKGILKKND